MSRFSGRFALLGSTKRQKNRIRSRREARRKLNLDRLESRLMMDATPIGDLSDEFDNSATISQWQQIHQTEGWAADQLNIYDINVTQPGRMVQQPHTTVWYQNYRGPMSFKTVTGDFAFTSEVHITDRDEIGGSDADDIPGDSMYSLGGLMVRTPRPITNPAVDWAPGSMVEDGTNNGENYVFLSLGYPQGTNQFSLEVKTTRNSNSQLELTPLGTTANTATIQIARIGNSIITLYQLPGQDWQVHRRYSRPDMPATLQVGLVSYSDWGKAGDYTPFTQNNTDLVPGIANNPTPAEPFNPDLTAGYEYGRYAHPDVPDELAGANMANPLEVSNAQLLSFLGGNANIVPTVDPEPDDDTPLVGVQFTLVDLLGNPIEELEVGQSFTLQVMVDDLRNEGTGVFSAFADVTYDGSLASMDGELVFGDDYDNAQEGNTETAGLIDDAGAISSTEELDGEPRVLFRIQMVATAVGELTFTGDVADLLPDHEVTMYGMTEPVPADRIEFHSATLTIVPATPPATAADDEFVVMNDEQSVMLDVLANDADPAVVDSLTIISVTPVALGDVSIDAEGNNIVFTPAGGMYGDAVFEYTLRDANDQESTATVSLSVHKRWHNPVIATDVNDDQFTSPMDALIVINSLITVGSIPLPAVPPALLANWREIDVSGDGNLSPFDALLVINQLIQQAFGRGSGEGEGESSFASIAAVHGATRGSCLSGNSTGESDTHSPQQFDEFAGIDCAIEEFDAPSRMLQPVSASDSTRATDMLLSTEDMDELLIEDCVVELGIE